MHDLNQHQPIARSPQYRFEAQLSQFVESVSSVVAMVDRQMKCRAVSPRWIVQWTRSHNASAEVWIGRSLWEVCPQFPDEIKAISAQCLSGGGARCEVIPTPNAEGNSEWVRWQIQPWYQEAGEIGGLMVFAEAIVDRVREKLPGAYQELLELYEQLEARYEERAVELKETNERLREEIRAHQEAEESLRKHAQMLDLANDTIMILDLNYKVTYWNSGAERLYGWTREEAGGRSVRELLRTEFPQTLEQIEDILWNQGYWQGELIHSKQDGTQIVVASRWTLQRNESGDPIAILEINHDISDRKQAEAALQRSEARLREKNQQLKQTLAELTATQAQLIQTEKMSSLGQLVAGVAHEINNPVNFIYGNLNHATQYMSDLLEIMELYQQHYPDPVGEIAEAAEAIDLEFILEDLPKMLGSMKIGAERIREIVRSLRNFARHDRSDFHRVDIHEGIDNTLLLLKHQLKEKCDRSKIQVIKDYGDVALVDCYAGQLNQVFMNILSNAIDALEVRGEESGVRSLENTDGDPSPVTPHSLPTIHIRTYTENRFAVIEIVDNGPGIPESIQRQLFDPFFTTKPPGKGTGLGLAIAYQIVVEKHRGTLQCFSAPGEGTRFKIAIPRQQAIASE